MASLLPAVAQRGAASNYARQLLAAFGKAGSHAGDGDRAPVTQRLIEPLSERELEVLVLLGTELSGPE